jgi:hypothetical protein
MAPIARRQRQVISQADAGLEAVGEADLLSCAAQLCGDLTGAN